MQVCDEKERERERELHRETWGRGCRSVMRERERQSWTESGGGKDGGL